jgi:hypothetical protein
LENLENGFEMRWWRRVEKINWTDRVRNEEMLHGVKEEKNILRTIKIRKANWIGHILRRNCLLQHVSAGKIEGSGDNEEDVIIYWMILGKKRENTGT